MRPLDEIERDCNAATEGPWRFDDSNGNTLFGGAGVEVLKAIEGHDWHEIDSYAEDDAFIENARTDVPDLCARVRELEASNDILEAKLSGANHTISDLLAELAAVKEREAALMAFANLVRNTGAGWTPDSQWIVDSDDFQKIIDALATLPIDTKPRVMHKGVPSAPLTEVSIPTVVITDIESECNVTELGGSGQLYCWEHLRPALDTAGCDDDRTGPREGE